MVFKSITLAAAILLPAVPALAQNAEASADAAVSQEAGAAEAAAEAQAPAAQEPAAADAVVLAAPADVKVGSVVNDQNGQNVGKIESVTTEGAVIATDKVRAQVPLSSFGKKGDTLVVGITKADFEAAVAKSTPPS